MNNLITDANIAKIEQCWKIKDEIAKNAQYKTELQPILDNVITALNTGQIQVVVKKQKWIINQWVKKAILLYLIVTDNTIYEAGCLRWYDKVKQRCAGSSEDDFIAQGCRLIPGAFVRDGSYLGNRTVIMPSFVNIGAYVGDGTMVDTWATIGSCAYIGSNCHISGGAGIGGVLEPIQSSPVIIEDNCFIGARSEIVEGVIVEEGSVISMGVYIGSSTKIVDRKTGKVSYGRVPAYSVVVPGTMPAKEPNMPSLYCAVIIKQVDESTRKKTAITELLRD